MQIVGVRVRINSQDFKRWFQGWPSLSVKMDQHNYFYLYFLTFVLLPYLAKLSKITNQKMNRSFTRSLKSIFLFSFPSISTYNKLSPLRMMWSRWDNPIRLYEIDIACCWSMYTFSTFREMSVPSVCVIN